MLFSVTYVSLSEVTEKVVGHRWIELCTILSYVSILWISYCTGWKKGHPRSSSVPAKLTPYFGLFRPFRQFRPCSALFAAYRPGLKGNSVRLKMLKAAEFWWSTEHYTVTQAMAKPNIWQNSTLSLRFFFFPWIQVKRNLRVQCSNFVSVYTSQRAHYPPPKLLI